jgi:integrase
MASVTRSGGRWIIRFYAAGGCRRTVRVGSLGVRESQDSLRLKISHLESAARRGAEPAADVLDWLERLDGATLKRFARAGLLVGQVAMAAETLQGDDAGERRVGGSKVDGAGAVRAMTLARFLEEYVTSRSDLKPLTIRHLNDVRRRLIEYFGPKKLLRDVTPGDADAWRAWLKAPKPKRSERVRSTAPLTVARPRGAGEGKGLSENTIRRWCGRAKQYFRAAIRRRLLTENPFADHKTAVQANKDRMFFVTPAMAEKVLRACPDAQWRLLFALSRYGGLRCPSEHLSLTWGDVNWEEGRVRVPSPKTEHHEGHASRLMPLFPELRPYLEAAFSEFEDQHRRPPAATEFVVTRHRDLTANLRTTMCRWIRAAGFEPWPKLFQNCRSTRETELAESFPLHVVTSWLGNSQPVALKHYLQVTEDHFARALRESTCQSAPQALHGSHFGADVCESVPIHETDNPSFPEENEGLQLNATLCETGMPPQGLEP